MYKTSEVSEAFKEYGNKFKNEQYTLADEIFSWSYANYENGGDVVVECMTFEEVIEEYSSLEEVKEMVELHLEQEKNCRWGEDNDPQLKRSPDNWVD